MTKTLLKGLLAVIVSGTLLTSCKKEKENILPTPKDHLVGKWQMTYSAFDDNENKILDEKEKEEAEDITFIFYPNGTGISHYHDDYYPMEDDEQSFTWSFQDSEKQIALVMTDEYGAETILAKINNLDRENLTLEINEEYGPGYDFTQWIIMKKIPL